MNAASKKNCKNKHFEFANNKYLSDSFPVYLLEWQCRLFRMHSSKYIDYYMMLSA